MTLKDFSDRYGPTLVIGLIMAVILVLLPGNPRDDQTLQAGNGFAASGASGLESGSAIDPSTGLAVSGGAGSAAAATGGAAGGAAGAVGGVVSGGTKLKVGTGPNCRPADNRQKGIAKYMPPCVEFSGDNGGATGQGVTKDKVLIVRYISQVTPATQAILEAYKLADKPEVVKRTYEALFKYGNAHYMTYGREVVFQDYPASGPDTSDEALKADAIKIATQIKPMAVWAGAGTKTLAVELAARGVACICTVSLTSQFYKENPPLIFGSLPTSTEYGIHVAEYVGKRLAGKNAQWAGDEYNPTQNFKNKRREFGLIYLEGQEGRVDPEGKRGRDFLVNELAKYGVKLKAEASYLYDPGRNQQDMTTMIATMKSAGVTTVISYVDPLTPIIFTAEASRQQYFPEWFQTGTGLSDTTAAGRIYDQQQWKHSFGISPLWVTWLNVANSSGYREFHHGMPGMRPGDEGVLVNIYQAPAQQIFIGIHMAGPKLSPMSFAQGQFAYPRTGGTAAAPLVYVTREFPTQIKDFVEIFYKSDERGKDERGEEGLGMIMKVEQGKRYQAGEWPANDPKVFSPNANAIAVSDNPVGGGPLPHEQDGHKHTTKCLTCSA